MWKVKFFNGLVIFKLEFSRRVNQSSMVLGLISDKTFIIIISLNNTVQKKTIITLNDAWTIFVKDPGLFVGGMAQE